MVKRLFYVVVFICLVNYVLGDEVLQRPEWDVYTRVKVDASYDTSATSNGNYVGWVTSEASNSDDDAFNLTMRETRLGLKLGYDADGIKTSGKIEMDFYGGGAENKATPMLRHAFLNLDFHNGNELLFGQTSDVISPLVPFTLNYPVAWWAGNIGYRRSQIRFTHIHSLGESESIKFQVALARAIGRTNGLGAGDTGSDAGIPNIQARFSYTTNLFNGRKSTFGISGHFGKEEYDTNVSGASETFNTYSLNLDLELGINESMKIKGEYYMGTNLDKYLGGIGQGVNTTSLEEIDSTGGWLSMWYKWDNEYSSNFGFSVDDPDSGLVTGDRESNMSIFGNFLYNITLNHQVGFELSYWKTEYMNVKEGSDIRAQFSYIFTY